MARVLVVDDLATNRELVVTLLGYAGHQLAEAGDGEEALAQVRKFRPDLVVCDILMPTMDGYQFVRQLRGDPAIASTEIIFYTATFLEREAHTLAAACGVRHVLTKPCEPEDILAAVQAALAHDRPEAPLVSAAPEFDRAHLRLVTDKLAEKADQLEHANRRLAALIDLSVQLASEREPATLLEKFCRSVRALFGSRLALLSVRDKAEPTALHFFAHGLRHEEAVLFQRMQAEPVLQSGSTTALLPCRFDESTGNAALRDTLARHVPGARTAVLAPVVSLHNWYGWILLVDRLGGDSFSEEDERTLAVQATQVGRIYENGSLYAKVQQQIGLLQVQALEREREGALLRLEHTVARALAVADELQGGVATVLQAICASQQWEVGRYWQADESVGLLRLAMEFDTATGSTADNPPQNVTVLRPGEGLAGYVWLSGQAMWVPDLRAEPRLKHRAVLRQDGLLSASLFPLVSDGRAIGVLSFLSRNTRQPDERVKASARVIGNQLGQFVRRKETEEALKASEHFIRSTLDSLLEHVCVIDSNGVILTVNRAWREFSASENGDPLRVLEGANYLQACDQAQGEGAADAVAMATGIREVIDGRQNIFAMEYPCGSATEARWFLARASRFAGSGPVRVVVAHEDITERKHAEQRIRRLHRVSTVLSEINALIVRVTHRDELFREACRIAIGTGRFNKAWIGLLHQDPLRIEVVAASDGASNSGYFEQVATELQQHLNSGSPQFEQLVVRQQPLVVNDIAASTWMTLREAALKSGSRSVVALPLVVGNQTLGLILLHADEVDFFDAEELKLLRELAGDLSFAMDHLRQAEQLNRLAYYDALTGHANSMLFRERSAQFVDAAMASHSRLAIGLLDIERFKSINDVWGRHTGDALLRQVAERVSSVLGDRSRMARVGPDQFAVVLQNAPQGIELARSLDDFYRACFGSAFDIDGSTIHVAARAGFALCPDDGGDAGTLFSHAEAAVKRAKRSTERVLLYDAHMSKVIAEKIALEMQLRDALERTRFVLYYQPKVDAVTRGIVGVEALIRWQDPELGLVPPGRFIPLMEETGLIVDVGSWALRQAAEDRRGWVRQGLTAPHVAVNVSAVQLRKRDFVDTVLLALGTRDAAAGIDLEITESAAMEDIDDTIAKLQHLRSHDIALAIDDFGTGYSSLAYLSKLPAQTLKIDRAFTMSMNEDANTLTLVSTMISLAHALRMQVVAEGVETEQQADTLRQLHCDQLQGYLISRPVPEPVFARMLQAACSSR